MKIFYLFFLLPFTSSCTFNSVFEVFDSNNFKGNVQSIQEISFLIAEDSLNNLKVIREARKKNDEDDFIMHFDREGRITSKIFFIKQDTVKIVTFDYQDPRYWIEKIEERKGLTSYSYYKWEENQITKQTSNVDNVVLSRHLYILNGQKKPKKEIIYYATGDIAYTKEYLYKMNNLIEERWINSEGGIYNKIFYQYNTKNNVVKECKFVGSNSDCSEWKYKYEYDSVGNWIARIDYYNNTPHYKIIREITYF